MSGMAYRNIAIQVGDALKYSTTLNGINRAAKSVFSFSYENFPNDSITSGRAQRIHDWVLTLAKQRMNDDERKRLLLKFLKLITSSNDAESVENILSQAGFITEGAESLKRFSSRAFHAKITEHCRKLYLDRHYFHAVFEAAKIYHKLVQEKSQSSKDGQALMLEAWSPDKGVLKITRCETETDKNVQDGIGFLSAGLMRAIRNPTAHEPALHWPISETDCLEILTFISFLLRKLDESVYYKGADS